MKYKIEGDKIIFDEPIRGKGAIKVIFYRGIDERKSSDLPVAYTDGKGKEYEWINGFNILAIHVKVPRFLGLFKKWVIAEPYDI